jgi:hypothetical protein
MNKLYFGWDYYNYSKQPDISKVISEKFPDLRPDGTYPNDSDTLPLQDDNYVITNPWHQLTGILSGYGGDIELIHRDSLELIEREIPFIYLIGIRSGPQEWGTDDRNKLFHNIKQHTKNYIKSGKVLVISDMSGEGYPVENVDELTFTETGGIPRNIPLYIEEAANREEFPLINMCYLTGNGNASKIMKIFYRSIIESKINIIHLCNSEIGLRKSVEENFISNNFNKVLQYKKDIIENPNTKYFLSLCKLVKDSRLYHSLGLNYYDLYDKALASLMIPEVEFQVAKVSDGTDSTDINAYDFNKGLITNPLLEDYIDIVILKLRLLGNVGLGQKIKSRDNIRSLLEKLPMYIDRKSVKGISGFTTWDDSFYNDTFFSYLYESYAYNNKTIYITEKFWKTVINFHPMLLVTNPYALRYLKRRGYKTFSPFIDESYDEEEDFNVRSEMLLAEVHKLCQMSKIELLSWYEDQEDILKYNYKKYLLDDPISESVNKITELYNLL